MTLKDYYKFTKKHMYDMHINECKKDANYLDNLKGRFKKLKWSEIEIVGTRWCFDDGDENYVFGDSDEIGIGFSSMTLQLLQLLQETTKISFGRKYINIETLLGKSGKYKLLIDDNVISIFDERFKKPMLLAEVILYDQE